MSRRLWLLPLTVALTACPPRIDTGDDGGGVIFAGPEGGIFFRDGAVLDIPKGALATTAQITVTVIDSGIPEVPGRKRVSLGYRFSPSSLVFKEPIKVTLAWNDQRVPKGVDPGTFDMRRQSGEDAYLALPGATTNTELKVLTARSDRLGLYWLTSPEQPAVSKITITPDQANLQVGGTQQFSAQVTDPTGSPLDVQITWSSLPPRAGKVDAAGLFTASGPGTATVTAKAGTLSASVPVRVQGSATGPMTFVHDNPFPTGNDLWGGAMVGGAAAFVGGNGTVLARAPTGTWSRLASAPGVVLKAIAGTQPDNAVAVGVFGSSGVLVEVKGTQPVTKLFQTIEPRALWFDGTNGMAVGYGNDVLVKRAGAEWVRESSPSIEVLMSVLGDAQGAFTTLGNRGSIYRYNPTTKTWNSLYQTQLSVLLTAAVLARADGTEAWAAGGNKLWRFSGGGWSAINLPAQPVLNELTAIAVVDQQVLLAGRQGRQGWLLTYDPSQANGDAGTPDAGTGTSGDGGTSDAGTPITFPPGWTGLPQRLPQITRGIFAQGTDAFAVGDFGSVWSYSGGTFTEVSRGFYGNVADVSVAGTTVVAAVNECASAACTARVGRVWVRRGPFDWAPLGGSQPFAGPLGSIAAESETNVAVGMAGSVFRYNGNAWTAIPATVLGANVNDLAFCGTALWAVGDQGTVLRGTTASLSLQTPLGQGNLFAIHCPSENSVWIAGDQGLYERSGAGFATRTTPNVNHSLWRAVWSPGQGEAFTFGDSRYGLYWDTAALKVIDAPGGVLPDVLHGLWGSSVDNLYAVGYTITPVPFGYAVRFDGAQWRLVDSGSQRRVTSIHGSSSKEVWLGTEGGGLLKGVSN